MAFNDEPQFNFYKQFINNPQWKQDYNEEEYEKMAQQKADKAVKEEIEQVHGANVELLDNNGVFIKGAWGDLSEAEKQHTKAHMAKQGEQLQQGQHIYKAFNKYRMKSERLRDQARVRDMDRKIIKDREQAQMESDAWRDHFSANDNPYRR